MNTKRPVPFAELSGEGVALRDVAFHEKHAACVDAAGNLYQWGDGFFADSLTSNKKPVPTLQGKVRENYFSFDLIANARRRILSN